MVGSSSHSCQFPTLVFLLVVHISPPPSLMQFQATPPICGPLSSDTAAGIFCCCGQLFSGYRYPLPPQLALQHLSESSSTTAAPGVAAGLHHRPGAASGINHRACLEQLHSHLVKYMYGGYNPLIYVIFDFQFFHTSRESSKFEEKISLVLV